MNIETKIDELKQRFNVIDVVNLDQWDEQLNESRQWLEHICQNLYKDSFADNDRIVFTHSADFYSDNADAGIILRNLQIILNQIDISNFFVVVVTTNPDIEKEYGVITAMSKDPIPINFMWATGEFRRSVLKDYSTRSETYQYGSTDPTKIGLNELTAREKFLLTESKTFCIYPWIHLHAHPTGKAYPCCHADLHQGVVGDCHEKTLAEIWVDEPMQRLRADMLKETPTPGCNRCYEQESVGFFSGRRSANKHHGHQIKKLEKNPFEMTYWDIRFSNLCNLSCRSCGHIFSSSWYADQAKLAGDEWKQQNKVLKIAGRNKDDMWQQLMPHLDYVEQIYFAGGEPLMMEEHYLILDELERRERFDVRLIYNTNFTQTRLKDREVFDYWRKFHSVAVGASLDGMEAYGEYIRHGTKWAQIERNRRVMIEQCPAVDFYISPTVSILNILHLPDFHRAWVEQGLIRAQDLNVNLLQDPDYLRIDIAPVDYKEKIKQKYQQHLTWLRPQDQLNRATVGFESAINFMMATDNSKLIPKFWSKTAELDIMRNENVLTAIPELLALQ